jgi:DNA-binding beta-propeller fold protein YncE
MQSRLSGVPVPRDLGAPFPNDAPRRRVALTLDLAVGPISFFLLLFGGIALSRLLETLWEPAAWMPLVLPGVLWLSVLLALAWRGQTPGAALLRLVWARRDGGPARWRPIGEPAFWAIVLPTLLLLWAPLVGQLVWMIVWPLYVLLRHASLHGMSLSGPAPLLPEIFGLPAIALLVVWARRRPAAWLVRHPLSAPLPREGRPTRRRGRYARLIGAGLAVTLLFAGAAHAQQLPAAAVAIGGMYPQDVQVDQRTGRAFVLDGMATTRDGQPLDHGAITVVGATGARLGVIPLSDGPCALALDERTRRAFVIVMRDHAHISVDEAVQTVNIDTRAALRSATLAEPSRASLRMASAVPVAPAGYQSACDANHIAIDETTNHVFVVNAVTYVDNGPAPFVAMLDARTGALIHKTLLPAAAARIVVFPRLHHAFVASTTGASLWMLDTRTGAILRTVSIGRGSAWRPVAADLVADRLFVGSSTVGMGGVTVVDARDGHIQRVIPTGQEPLHIAVDGTRERLFMLIDSGPPHRPAYTLRALDLRRDKVLRTVAVPDVNAIATTVDERTGRVIVLGSPAADWTRRETLQVFDAATGVLMKTTHFDYAASGLAVAQRNRRIVVVGDYTADAPFWPWSQDTMDRGVVTALNTDA